MIQDIPAPMPLGERARIADKAARIIYYADPPLSLEGIRYVVDKALMDALKQERLRIVEWARPQEGSEG